MAMVSLLLPLTSTYQPWLPTCVFVGVVCGLYLGLSGCGSRAKGLPPGPPTKPILGNLTVFPKSLLHLQFTKWAKIYGDVFSLKVMNQTIIVLNTPTGVREIIDKRSTSSSNRPKSIIADMITPRGLNLGTGRYANETWSVLRKAVTQLLNTQKIRKQRNYQRAEATQLLFDLVHEPEKWYTQVQRTIFSLALGIVYGCRSPLITSKGVADILYVNPQFIDALEFGRLPPVDLFPILTLVPERFAKWKRTVKNIRRLQETMYGDLLQRVESRIASGQSTPGFMEDAIKNSRSWGLEDHDMMMHLGGVLLTGADTSAATLQTVILCLVSFPEETKKAQDEIDRVVGTDRLPTWEDIPHLPYTMAFLEETMRFRPMGPSGLPHEMVQDEVVDGVLYPKGAVVFANTWAIFHDERYFESPEKFMPERFLKNQYGVRDVDQDDPARRPNILFGGGRRVCPGIAFAKDTLEFNTCGLIWAFDFLPSIDKNGHELPPDINGFSSGLTGNPLPFDCRIKPRSPQRVELIKQQFSKVAEFLVPYELEFDAEEKKFNATYRDS